MVNEKRIPKIVHYAWFGKGKKGKLVEKCMASWKKFLPDYEFIEWNEDNFDLEMYPYAKAAYENKKFAYVSDVVRLHVLYYMGGIYMDSDVEVRKNFDTLLDLHGFSGFQSEKEIPTGIIAAEKENLWIKEQLDFYKEAIFDLNDINTKKITNVDIITTMSLKKHGLVLNNRTQILEYGMKIFPIDYFCAKNARTGKINITENTYTIHHFAGSWISHSARIHKKIYKLFSLIIGDSNTQKIYNLLKKDQQ